MCRGVRRKARIFFHNAVYEKGVWGCQFWVFLGYRLVWGGF